MRILWPVPLVLLITGCGQQEVTERTYREIATPAPSSVGTRPESAQGESPGMTGAVPASSVEINWETPEGWQEQPGTGVRLVTFAVDEAECTLTAFPGDVGGLRANLGRWLGQLNVQIGSPEAMDDFISSAVPVEGPLPGQIFDFGRWVSDDPAATSMLAAVFEKAGSTVFVKMMGPQAVLAEQRIAFDGLCRSIK